LTLIFKERGAFMKKAIILLIFLFIFVLTMSAGSVHTLMAQNSPAPAETPEAAPAAAPAATQAEPAPAPAEPSQAAPAETKTEAPAPAAPEAAAPASPAETKMEAPAAPPSTNAVATGTTATPAQEAPQKSFMVRLSHKEFANMSLKECADCHKGSGVAPTHGSDQMREHVSIARRSGKNCVDCHNQQFCLDCHKGGGIDADLRTDNYRRDYIPNTHRTDFIEIHPIKSVDNPQTCYRCHNARFCSSCHAKFRGEDLMVQSHRKSWSDLRPSALGPTHSTFTTAQCQTCHPGGLLPKRQWSADHAREARRNLQACQTCHSDGEICMKCHSARTGLMINPHPRDWRSVSGRYRSKSDGRSCIKCHDHF
jgi:hypothetical protein